MDLRRSIRRGQRSNRLTIDQWIAPEVVESLKRFQGGFSILACVRLLFGSVNILASN